ncbi:hypothetical protein CHS0354_037422 [Potamilus streckersoni]|uniref:Uncharacterized protein n=1 Tax=Potamilus streckersoni TaxID=2493646 RepID=A0AAE0VIY1_9BIVA|nr:hypothetical protein CHS0354_037422 [Potamilus streckersoni]
MYLTYLSNASCLHPLVIQLTSHGHFLHLMVIQLISHAHSAHIPWSFSSLPIVIPYIPQSFSSLPMVIPYIPWSFSSHYVGIEIFEIVHRKYNQVEVISLQMLKRKDFLTCLLSVND